MKSILVVFDTPYCAPGSRRAPALPAFSAEPRAEKFMSNFTSTHTVIRAAPEMSSTALMIWTYVVPFMPPIST